VNKTAILIILDRSGSMSSIAQEVREGFATFVQEQREAPDEATLSLVQFDNQYEMNYSHVPIEDAPPLVFEPRGMTSLLDAIGRGVVDFTTSHEALPKSERSNKFIVLVMTDGAENSSQEWTKPRIVEMIEAKKKLGWEFVYIGASMEGVNDAHGYGIQASVGSLKSAGTAATFGSMSRGVASYRSGGGYTTGSIEPDKK